MKPIFRFLLGLIPSLTSALGFTADPVQTSNRSPEITIHVDSSVMPSDRKLMLEDLELINELRRDHFEFHGEEKKSLALQEIQQRPMEWLQMRVRFLLGRMRKIGLEENIEEIPIINLGAQLSAMNAPTNSPLIAISSLEPIVVSGASVGLLQFLVDARNLRLDRMQLSTSFLNRIYRLGLLFHAARHSDQQTEGIGLQHRVCPENHVASRKILCDEVIDGSYGVETFVLRALKRSFEAKISAEDQARLETWIQERRQFIVGQGLHSKG